MYTKEKKCRTRLLVYFVICHCDISNVLEKHSSTARAITALLPINPKMHSRSYIFSINIMNASEKSAFLVFTVLLFRVI